MCIRDRSKSLSVPDVRAPIFIASARLVPRSNTAAPFARIWPLSGAPTDSSPMVAERGANRPATSKNATSGQLAIASNARAHYAPKPAHAFVSKRRRRSEGNLCTRLNSSDPSEPSSARRQGLSAAVGSTNTVPAVAHLVIVYTGIVYRGRKTENLRCEPSHRCQDPV